jgi:Ca2+-binding RTX toxin-like protein
MQTRAIRRTWATSIAAVALLISGAVPATVGAASAVTPLCHGLPATMVGQPGQAAIRGSQGPDVIVGLEVGVRIDGRGGDDTICAGAGDNIINAGAGTDWVDAGEGNNTVDGGEGDDTVLAGGGDDTLLGGTGNDTVFAGEGDNLVSTGSGNDVIVTGSGDDRIDGAKDFDSCDGGAGVNYVGHCEVVPSAQPTIPPATPDELTA